MFSCKFFHVSIKLGLKLLSRHLSKNIAYCMTIDPSRIQTMPGLRREGVRRHWEAFLYRSSALGELFTCDAASLD